MGVVEEISPAEVSQLVNTSGVDLILSDLLSSKNGGWFEFSFCLAILEPISSVYLLQFLAGFGYLEQNIAIVWIDYLFI